MRYIVVPEVVEVFNFDGSRPRNERGEEKPMHVSMADFVAGRTVDSSYPKSGAVDMGTLERALRTREAFRAKAPGDVVALEEDDWIELRRVTETPAPPGYQPVIGAACLPFMHAITSARTDRASVEKTTNGTRERADQGAS